jgi:streptogramin lyase
MVAGGALMLVVAVVLFVYARSRDGASPVTIVPPAVVAVDAATNRVVASIPVGSEPISIASGEGAVWVGDAADGTVTRIDPASRRTQAIGIDAPAIDLAAGGGNVWVATGGFGAIVRIDSRLRRVTARFPLGTPGDPVVPAASAVGVGQGRLWVGAFDGLARLDPRTGRILEKVDLGASPALQIAIGEDDLWATLLTHRARRVEASSGTPTAAFYSGTFALGVALGAGAVWLAGHDVGTLWKLDPVTGSLQTSSRVGDDAHGVAVGAGAVWVASTHDRALVRVDPDSGETVATIPMGGEPQDVVVRDGIVWVAVQAPPPAS